MQKRSFISGPFVSPSGQDDTLMLEAPSSQPKSKNQLRNFTNDMLELKVSTAQKHNLFCFK